jgi:serine/threonine-protein kinase
VQGKSETVATSEIQQAGLQWKIGDPVQNATCEKGTVVDQSPGPNSEAAKNSVVTLQICDGKPQVTVPRGLVGSTYESAKSRLDELKLQVTRKDVDSGQPEGQVTKVTPGEGSTVVVEVSKGNITKVPDVVGLPEDRATKMLEDAGYKVRKFEGNEVSPDKAGLVSSQKPGGDATAEKGTRVTIYVDYAAPEPSDSATATPTPSGSPTGGGGGFPFPSPPTQDATRE